MELRGSAIVNGRLALGAIAMALVVLFFSGNWIVCTDTAYADVRKADVIAGSTVEARGLSVAACPSVEAEHAVLVDENGAVYFERDATSPAQIASITKVMTAIVALENAPDGMYVVVSENAATIGESSANLQEGDTMDFETALKALLIPSGNDAAVALSESVGAAMIAADPSLGNNPVQVFVDAMNAKAQELGCTDTVYENPHGLDDEQFAGSLHSTAADQARVAKCAMSYSKIRDIVSGGTATVTVTRDGAPVSIELQTTDELLEMYEYTIGVKTGVTLLAGPSFMGAAEKDGRQLYSVVLNSTDEYQRFADTKNLFEWGYQHIIQVKLSNSDESTSMTLNGTKRDVPVFAQVDHLDWPDKAVKATMSDPDAAITVFDLEGNVTQTVTFEELHGNILAGDKVGKVVFKQRNQVVAEQDLVACEDVAAPNPFEAIAIWWQGLIGGPGDNHEYASQVYNVMPVINNHVANAA